MLSTLSAIGTAISRTIGQMSGSATSARGALGDQTFTAQESPARATLRAPASSGQQAALPGIKTSGNSAVQRHKGHARQNASTPAELATLTNGSNAPVGGHRRQKAYTEAEVRALMNAENKPKTRTYVGNCKRMIEKTKGHAPSTH